MCNKIKKNVNSSLGLASTTKEKVKSFVNELRKKDQFIKEEKAKAVKEIRHTLEEKEKELDEKAGTVVSEALSEIQDTAKKELEELNKSIAEMEKILSTKSNENEPMQ